MRKRKPMIVYDSHPQDSRIKRCDDVCQTLTSMMAGGGNKPFVTTYYGEDYIVRIITPLEAERFQGFPDGYTDIPYHGKKHSPDSLRSKALGNSMAVPVMKWIAQRIDWALAHPITENTAKPVDWQPSLFF